MKKFVCAIALVLGWTIAAQAAVVYLKDGGTINARNVWREKGKVVVLVNRESITSFSENEVNMKKTFPPRKKRVKAVAKPAPASATAVKVPQGTDASVPAAAPAPEKTEKTEKKFTLPSLPNKLPEREIPKGSEEGALRKQKREMEERLKD